MDVNDADDADEESMVGTVFVVATRLDFSVLDVLLPLPPPSFPLLLLLLRRLCSASSFPSESSCAPYE